jgi:hypothetical protein
MVDTAIIMVTVTMATAMVTITMVRGGWGAVTVVIMGPSSSTNMTLRGSNTARPIWVSRRCNWARCPRKGSEAILCRIPE